MFQNKNLLQYIDQIIIYFFENYYTITLLSKGKILSIDCSSLIWLISTIFLKSRSILINLSNYFEKYRF